MTRVLLRSGVGAIVGALAGPALLVLLYALNPGLAMNPQVTSVVRGVYAMERSGDEVFSWTGPQATLVLPGLDRRVPWSCTARLRGARENPATLPDVSAAVDGAAVMTMRTTNDYGNLAFTVPPSAGAGRAILTLAASNTFQPGGTDRRALGFRLASWTCAPAGSGIVLPPRQALTEMAVATAVFGIAFGLMDVTVSGLILALFLLAAGQAAVITRGLGIFLPYVTRAPWLAAWIGLAAVLATHAIEWGTGTRMQRAARFVMVFSAGSLYLKLLALLHPAKGLVDALFHAHRLEWVLGGRYFFTQPLASGLEFPYAIGLYVFAAPWSALTHDHVALLDVIVAASEVLAGALLYWTVVRTWGDRLAGAVAVTLFSIVPLAYDVVGHANLTNAFAQSVALVGVLAATVWTFERHRVVQFIGLIGLVALALLSHVSTFALLTMTLLVIATLDRAVGGRSFGRVACAVSAATVVAVVIAVGLYYAHFLGAYESVLRASAPQVTVATPTSTAATNAAAGTTVATNGEVPHPAPLYARAENALALTLATIGWPILILAVAGAWRVWREGGRDRLTFTVVGWGAAFAAFMAVGVAAPVDASNQRYAAEFVARTAYATYPAAVILAARGGVWAWRSNVFGRVAAIIVAAAAMDLGVRAWLGWLG